MSSAELVSAPRGRHDDDSPAAAGTASDVLTLPEGLVGLPSARRFRRGLLDGGPLLTLDGLDEPALEFVAAPLELVDAAALERLRERALVPPDGAAIVLLSVHGEPPRLTANLAGPIVLEGDGATGRQLVLEGPEFLLRAPLSVPD